jgi:outer membrane protein TolC
MNARIACLLSVVCMTSLCLVSVCSRADEPKPTGESAKIKELQKERLAVLKEAARFAKERMRNGQGTADELREAERMLLDAELDLCNNDKERVEILERHLAQAQEIEKMMDQLAKAGLLGTKSTLLAKADRLQVEIALARAKEKIDGRK